MRAVNIVSRHAFLRGHVESIKGQGQSMCVFTGALLFIYHISCIRFLVFELYKTLVYVIHIMYDINCSCMNFHVQLSPSLH